MSDKLSTTLTYFYYITPKLRVTVVFNWQSLESASKSHDRSFDAAVN